MEHNTGEGELLDTDTINQLKTTLGQDNDTKVRTEDPIKGIQEKIQERKIW